MDEKLVWSKFSQNALRCLKSGHNFVIKSAAKTNENRLTNKRQDVENYFGIGVLHGQSQEMEPEILFFRNILGPNI